MVAINMLSGVAGALNAHLTEILATLAFFFFALYLWLQYQYSYWRRHRVPYIEPTMIFGNLKGIINSESDPCSWFQYLYNHEKAKDHAAVGIYVFNKPSLLIRDLELIKTILIKDFNYFSNRHSASDPHSDSLGSNSLFFAKNPRWKEIRVKLTPVFSSGRMKQMFPLIEEIAREYDKYLCALKMDPKTNSTVLDVKEPNALYTTDVIAITAYGVQANSLNDPNGIFRKSGKRIFTFTWLRAMEFKAFFFIPMLVKIFRFKVFSAETTVFLRNTINHVMEERERSGAVRNDLIDTLIKFRREAEKELKEGKKPFILEGDALAAQAAIFFSAGFETTSATMSFTMFEMARHPEMQQRLREEIRIALQSNDGKVTYELIVGLKYMDNVVKEVLRRYPPLPFIDRVCTPKAGEKGYSLKEFGIDFDVPKDMPIYVANHAVQMDPRNFKDPEQFNPDRFLPENKQDNNMNAYIPFGTGPHNCIGERFAMMQTKLGLLYFYRNHYVTACDKTPQKIQLDPRAVLIQSIGGIHVNVVRDPLF
ncbi:PREDICTED: probable cytochrome P450 6g2 [Rhagoletis zephyria]|uniref:probable cytochrome P450 6g2 n=1 Tax=Rhagoletis zephyria TaxID=28612 RepID=UPI0008119BE1|nr:PREDICTED: probable cytochrome P450 6g2 [Rhagoletis zephyria]